MSIAGREGTAQLLSSLNPDSLRRLVADVLFTRRHTQIRQTDGPGDGGRDIHSLSRSGDWHVTQTKWHQDIEQACSSAELSELPMAMTKFGYPKGLFVTNARISPQAKREYLDSYPGLTLEFLDGDALAHEVLGNALLRAVWFDGQTIRRIDSAAFFPFLVRKHDTDTPIVPQYYFRDCNPGEAILFLKEHHPDLEFTLRPAFSSSESFSRYRQPPLPSMEEGYPSHLRVSEVGVAGELRLADLPQIATNVCKAVAKWLDPYFPGFTVCVGRPYITHLTGDAKDSGTFVLGDEIRACYLVTSVSGGSESEWFAAEPSEVWTSTSDARVTEAESIRLYAESLDVCLRYEIVASVGRTYEDGTGVLHVIRRRGWNRSVFALIPKWTDWPYSFPQPDDKIEWPWDGRILCGWFHWTLLGGSVGVHVASEQPPLFKEPTDEEEAARLGAVRDALKAIDGADLVDPVKARHMLALVGEDPFADSETRVFHTGEVTSYFDELVPSPVLPGSRAFHVEIVWSTKIPVDELKAAVQALAESCGLVSSGEWEVECDGDYVVVEGRLKPAGVETLPTFAILEEFRARITCWLAGVEDRFSEGALTRSTKEYWRRKYGVSLGTPWHESLMPYVWTPDEDGRVRTFRGVDLDDGSGEPDFKKVFGRDAPDTPDQT